MDRNYNKVKTLWKYELDDVAVSDNGTVTELKGNWFRFI